MDKSLFGQLNHTVPSPLTSNGSHLLLYVHSSLQKILGLSEKFMDSSYYSKLELGEGVVMASFSKYLPWEAMHFLQCFAHFSKTCCRPLITSKFLALELPFHGWKGPEITWGKIWTVWQMFYGVPLIHFFQAEHRIQFRSHPMRFLGFSNHKKGAMKQEISK
jgi:hypothetical protein